MRSLGYGFTTAYLNQRGGVPAMELSRKVIHNELTLKDIEDGLKNSRYTKKLVKESLFEAKEKLYDPFGIASSPNKIEAIQDEDDESMFKVFLVPMVNDYAWASGDEFNSEMFDMTLQEMLIFIDKGIKHFQRSDNVITKEELAKSEWSDFFTEELYGEEAMEESFAKIYVIGKLIAGKENAKWNDKNKSE